MKIRNLKKRNSRKYVFFRLPRGFYPDFIIYPGLYERHYKDSSIWPVVKESIL